MLNFVSKIGQRKKTKKDEKKPNDQANDPDVYFEDFVYSLIRISMSSFVKLSSIPYRSHCNQI